jgi:hypothetical protein
MMGGAFGSDVSFHSSIFKMYVEHIVSGLVYILHYRKFGNIEGI